MEERASVLDGMREEELPDLSGTELHDSIAWLERESRAIEAERARRLAEAQRRRSHAADGYVSMTAWLRHRLGLSGKVAREQTRLARALGYMPLARAALAEGAISVSAASLLVSARESDPDEFQCAEAMLVDLARRVVPADLGRAIEHWRMLADATRDDADARRYQRRGLHISPILDGMVRLDGELDPETGQTVITAVRSIQDSWSRRGGTDVRTSAQQRADALGEICRAYLDSRDRAEIAGERPHVVVTLDLDTLERRVGRRCELDDAGVISAETARRLACDASISRVIVGPGSEPLDVGRRTQVVPAGLRRALVFRDGGCRFPGCGRPHTWCDGHHVMHWADGGATALANLVLLCRRHHRLVHQGFTVEVLDDQVVFRRPDGIVLEESVDARAPTAA